MTAPDIADVQAGDWVKVRTVSDGHEGVWEGHCWAFAGRLLFAGSDILCDTSDLGPRAAELLDHRPASIPEPTGLGAVVRDADGWIATGVGDAMGGRRRWVREGYSSFNYWDDIPQPVTVLTEGVTP